MFASSPAIAAAAHVFLVGVLIILSILCMLTLLRMILGPSVADRVLAANMMGGIVIVMMSLLGLIMGENFFLDVMLVYALISFLAVVILSQIFIGVYRDRFAEEENDEEKGGQN